MKRIRRIVREGIEELKSQAKGEPKAHIALVGGIYVVLDPFSNQYIEERLRERWGVEVSRTIYLSQWIVHHLVLPTFRLHRPNRSLGLASGYLNYAVGGHGLETVANTVLAARRRFDGVVQLAPFTCMPGIVAASILPRVSKGEGISVLTLFLDERHRRGRSCDEAGGLCGHAAGTTTPKEARPWDIILGLMLAL